MKINISKLNNIFFIIIVMMFSCDSYARNASLDEIQKNIRNEENELKKIRAEKGAALKQLKIIDSKIGNYKKLISQLKREQLLAEIKIKNIREEVKRISENIKRSKNDIAKSNMYIIDNMGYSSIKIITTAEKPEETVKILEILGIATNNLGEKVKELNRDIENLKQLKNEEEAKIDEVAILKDTNLKAVKELNEENIRYKNTLALIKHDEVAKKEYIDFLNFQRDELEISIKNNTKEPTYTDTEENEESLNNTIDFSNKNNKIKTFGEDKPINSSMADKSSFGKLVGKLPRPVNGKIIENYGEYIIPEAGVKIMHKGIKIAVNETSDIKAVGKGRIVFADTVKNFNNLVIVDHGSSYYTVYGNLDKIDVYSGKVVKQGESLGQILGIQDLENPYLYFEIRKKEDALNPMLWFKK